MINIFKENIKNSFPLSSRIAVQYEKSVFPGGEVNILLKDKIDYNDKVTIEAKIRSSDDLMTLFMLTDAIKRKFPKKIELVMPYVPYARQDRNMKDGDSLSIKVFADLINAQGYKKVTVWDAHSDVAPALINNCVNVPQYKLVEHILGVDEAVSNLVLVAPDAGAQKKVFTFAKYFGITDIATADKVRNPLDGKIIGTTFKSLPMHKNKTHLIVDDICDGGATFIALAKEIKKFYEDDSVKIKLLVTHGIFSKGKEVFNGLIDEVFAIDDWTK